MGVAKMLDWRMFLVQGSAWLGAVGADWPRWAIYPFIGLLAVLLVCLGINSCLEESKSACEPAGIFAKRIARNDNHGDNRRNYKAFRLQYFLLYVVLMLSDWVQGTNMYTLYQSYG